jgi:hypothetical protein
MTRLPVFGTAVTCAVAGFVVAGVPAASAEPPPPCAFVLSTPYVDDVAGVPTVTATVTPGSCVPPGAADLSVACLQALDGSSRLCSQGRGPDGARVQLGPVRPGVTYEATGRGVPTWLGQQAAPEWQILGPLRTTLG